jgi:DNA-directed RNA polymerase specialized sigma24 family protein
MTPILRFHQVENKVTVHFENFDLIFDKYAPMIYGIILRAVKQDVVLAEKITGEVFVEVYRNIQNYNSNKQRFGTWLIITATNLLQQYGYRAELLTVADKTLL